jgi:hypothetical protein
LYGTLAGQALNALIVGSVLWISWFLHVREREDKTAADS